MGPWTYFRTIHMQRGRASRDTLENMSKLGQNVMLTLIIRHQLIRLVILVIQMALSVLV